MTIMIIGFVALFDLASVNAAPNDKLQSGKLFGVGYREQELQQAKSGKFDSEAVGVVEHASFAGGTNIFIKGTNLAMAPEANLIVMRSREFEEKFLAPMLNLDDSFQSSTANGMLSYRLPSIERLFGIPEAEFRHYTSLNFDVMIRTITEVGFVDL